MDGGWMIEQVQGKGNTAPVPAYGHALAALSQREVLTYVSPEQVEGAGLLPRKRGDRVELLPADELLDGALVSGMQSLDVQVGNIGARNVARLSFERITAGLPFDVDLLPLVPLDRVKELVIDAAPASLEIPDAIRSHPAVRLRVAGSSTEPLRACTLWR